MNVKGIKKNELGNLNPCTFTFIHFFITSNYKLIFLHSMGLLEQVCQFNIGLENICRNSSFQLLKESDHVSRLGQVPSLNGSLE